MSATGELLISCLEHSRADITKARLLHLIGSNSKSGSSSLDGMREAIVSAEGWHVAAGRLLKPEPKGNPMRIEWKSAGTFTAYASVFGEIDCVQDQVKPGAYKRTLQQKGTMRPLCWQHDMTQLIGLAEACMKTHTG